MKLLSLTILLAFSAFSQPLTVPTNGGGQWTVYHAAVNNGNMKNLPGQHGLYFDFPVATDWIQAAFTTFGNPRPISGTVQIMLQVATTGSPVFSYYPDSYNCPPSTTVRAYFDSQALASNYSPYRWWSNPISYAIGPGMVVLTIPLTGDQWSGYNGDFGTARPADFSATLANMTSIGLTFGGGCFFENGVQVSGGGTAQFQLLGYSIF